MALHLILDNLDPQIEKNFKMMCIDKGKDFKEEVKDLIEAKTTAWLMSDKEMATGEDKDEIDFTTD